MSTKIITVFSPLQAQLQSFSIFSHSSHYWDWRRDDDLVDDSFPFPPFNQYSSWFSLSPSSSSSSPHGYFPLCPSPLSTLRHYHWAVSVNSLESEGKGPLCSIYSKNGWVERTLSFVDSSLPFIRPLLRMSPSLIEREKRNWDSSVHRSRDNHRNTMGWEHPVRLWPDH